MSEVGEVLAVLRAQDIRLMADGDQLHYDTPEDAITEEVLTLLGHHKQELLVVLAQPAPAQEATATAPSPQEACPHPAPLTPCYPCVVCGSTDRWEDRGLWRCGACWPRVAYRTPQEPPHDA